MQIKSMIVPALLALSLTAACGSDNDTKADDKASATASDAASTASDEASEAGKDATDGASDAADELAQDLDLKVKEAENADDEKNCQLLDADAVGDILGSDAERRTMPTTTVGQTSPEGGKMLQQCMYTVDGGFATYAVQLMEDDAAAAAAVDSFSGAENKGSFAAEHGDKSMGQVVTVNGKDVHRVYMSVGKYFVVADSEFGDAAKAEENANKVAKHLTDEIN